MKNMGGISSYSVARDTTYIVWKRLRIAKYDTLTAKNRYFHSVEAFLHGFIPG